MLSFQGQYTQCQNLSQDNSDPALVFFKTNLNLGLHEVEDKLESYLIEDSWTDLTEASVYSYPTLDRFIRLTEAYITIGGTQYPPMIQVFDEGEWQRLRANSSTSDTPTHLFVRGDTIEFYPTPATAGNTITFQAELGKKDLSQDDYTTGTITTLANGGVAVVGSGTAWTSAMIGRYLKVGAYPVWYKVSGVTDTTHLTLSKQYQGIAISAGTETYTIGEMPPIPDTTHMIPVWYALMNYYLGFKQNDSKFLLYKGLFDSELKKVKPIKQKRSVSNYIPGNRTIITQPVNPNHYPSNMSG